MYVLTLHGYPVASGDRWQRMRLAMAAYDREDQEHMDITSVEVMT